MAFGQRVLPRTPRLKARKPVFTKAELKIIKSSLNPFYNIAANNIELKECRYLLKKYNTLLKKIDKELGI